MGEDDPDFRALVANLHEEQRLRGGDEREQKEVEQQARHLQVSSGVRWLRENALPLLERARLALEEHNILLEIKEDFDVTIFLSKCPEVIFRCLSPPRPRDSFRHNGKAFGIDCDGTVCRVRQSKTDVSSYPDLPSAEFPMGEPKSKQYITQVITDCIEEYYRNTSSKVTW
jgi:hypothetical protein